MLPASLNAAKRDHQELTDEEIGFFIQGFATGSIPDYQMSAMAMAIYLNGMTPNEIAKLTAEMLRSGTQLAWPADGIPRVDKHSTGGIGDKTSLIIAPLLAECGLQNPMLSGRGLGATGGTLDKLEAIPGFRTKPVARRDHPADPIYRLRHHRRLRRTGSGRSQAVRPSRRHGDSAIHSVDHWQHHEQETGRIAQRLGPGCQIRQRCIHEDS